jgi:hypothetical protein
MTNGWAGVDNPSIPVDKAPLECQTSGFLWKSPPC